MGFSSHTTQAFAAMSLAPQRKLLERFYAREVRRLGQSGVASTLPVPVASSSQLEAGQSKAQQRRAAVEAAIPSLSWASTESNPFLRQKRELPSASTSRTVWQSPRYSLRRQKNLARALNTVQALSPDDLSSWKLPSSAKVQAEGGKRSKLQQTVEDYLEEYVNTDAKGKEIVFQQGPYKGRSGKPLKLHKWEREAESIRQSRLEKQRTMPSRIADYMKVRKLLPTSVRLATR